MSEATAVVVQRPMDVQIRAEIDTQIATAKMYPRDVDKAIDDAMKMATRNKAIAGACSYTAPWDKSIKGPSVRLAEIVASTWGNLRVREWLVEENEDSVLCEAYAHDLESNNAQGAQCRRSIIDKTGKRYKQQTISTTIAAAMSIARRNAIYKVVPRAVVDEIREATIDCVLNVDKKSPNAQTEEQRRQNCLKYFEKLNVTPAQILRYLGRAEVDDITLDDITQLIGVHTAIKEGESTIEDVFGGDTSVDALWKQINIMQNKPGGQALFNKICKAIASDVDPKDFDATKLDQVASGMAAEQDTLV